VGGGGPPPPPKSTGRERSELRERGVWGANSGIGDFLISGLSQLQGFKKLQGNYREEAESLDAKRAFADFAVPFQRKSGSVSAQIDPDCGSVSAQIPLQNSLILWITFLPVDNSVKIVCS